MKNLIFTLSILIVPLVFNAQCRHDDHTMCGIFEPDSTIMTTINSTYSNEPVRVEATVKDGLVFIEGGILVKDLNKVSSRGVACDVCAPWPNGVIPYEIDPNANYPKAMLDAIKKGIDELNRETGIKIIPRTTEENYIFIINGSGCYSSIGNTRVGKQTLSLRYPGCNSPKTVMHEFMHAAGVFHEQSREDRDKHIKINFDNMNSTFASNFKIYANYSKDIGEYDKGSVMHYSPYAFSSNGQPTITNMDGSITGIGNSTGHLTQKDINTIVSIYGEAPLPVEFVDINATSENGSTTVTWSTASEINNEGFYVQKSNDGYNFVDLDFIAPKGKVNGMKSYQYIDYNSNSGTVYYRIKQVDYDNAETFSNIVSVTNPSVAKAAVYPTVTSQYLFVRNENIKSVTVYDINGTAHVFDTYNGKIDVSHLPAGAYIANTAKDINSTFIKN